MKVIENKERLEIDNQKHLRIRFDKLSKLEKKMKKNKEGDEEEKHMIAEKKHEKLAAAIKRRDLIRDEFEKNLRAKDEHYKIKM